MDLPKGPSAFELLLIAALAMAIMMTWQTAINAALTYLGVS